MRQSLTEQSLHPFARWLRLMGQHIGVELRHPLTGAILVALQPLGANIAPFVPPFADAEYPHLGFVDPYGDTYFSSFQMKAVIPEIRRLIERDPDPLLVQLLELAKTCERTPDSFLVFVGD